MKTLLLLRHGKSDWDAPYGHDHDRPLAKRGRKAARKMGRWLAERGPVPDHIVSSTAIRARTTARRANDEGGWDAPVTLDEVLYGASPDDVLALVRAEADATDVLMLVGHEPTWSETVDAFVGGFDAHFPTAAIARIDFDAAHWSEVGFGAGRLAWIARPREID